MTSRAYARTSVIFKVEDMTPIKLTDDEMEAVYNACRPLHVADRDAFLRAIADALRRRGELGPGAVLMPLSETDLNG